MNTRKRMFAAEQLESRTMLDGTGLPGNECPPDLDLTAIGPQTAMVGVEFVLNLPADGATVVDLNSNGQPTGDTIRWQLDPDVPSDTPAGATMTTDGVFRWTPTAAQLGMHDIVVLVVDEGSPRLADAEVFTIEVVTQPPMLDLNGADAGNDFAATYTEGDDPVSIVDIDLTITDADSTQLASARVVITNLLDGSDEELLVDRTGTAIVSTYDAATGTLTLTGMDSLANYQDVLRTLQYVNRSDNPDTTDRRIEVTVNDGTNDSNVAVSTVSVVAVNDAPNLAPVADVSVELGQLVEVTVTATDPEGDPLTFQLDRDDPNSTLPAAATIEQIDNTTAVIRWTADTTGTFRFVVLVTDVAGGVDRETFDVTVTDVVPVLDLNGDDPGTDFAASFTEDDDCVAIVGSGLTVTDPDDTQLQSATATITNLLDGPAEEICVDTTGTNIMASYDSATGTLSLTGIETVENYQTVLRSLQYENRSQAPDAATRDIEIVVSDGTHVSQVVRTLVTVVAVDDAPELTLPAPYDNETTPVQITLGDMVQFVATATDPDTPSMELVFSLDLTASGISAGAAMPTITTPPGTVPGGEFSWTPDELGTFTITVVVTDSTSLSSSRTFIIEVISPIALRGGQAGTTELHGRWAESIDQVFAQPM